MQTINWRAIAVKKIILLLLFIVTTILFLFNSFKASSNGKSSTSGTVILVSKTPTVNLITVFSMTLEPAFLFCLITRPTSVSS